MLNISFKVTANKRTMCQVRGKINGKPYSLSINFDTEKIIAHLPYKHNLELSMKDYNEFDGNLGDFLQAEIEKHPSYYEMLK